MGSIPAKKRENNNSVSEEPKVVDGEGPEPVIEGRCSCPCNKLAYSAELYILSGYCRAFIICVCATLSLDKVGKKLRIPGVLRRLSFLRHELFTTCLSYIGNATAAL